jgi:hypothetical protein
MERQSNGAYAFRIDKINFKLSMLSRLVFFFVLLAKHIRLNISKPDAVSASPLHPFRGYRLVGD